MVNALQVCAHRPLPVRGLVFTHNARGQRIRRSDLLRWLRLNHQGFKCRKVDVITEDPGPDAMLDLLREAREIDLHLSLRTSADAPPEGLELLRTEGLWDVVLTPRDYACPALDAWLEACAALGLSVRVQFTGRVPTEFDVAHQAERLAAARVVAVHVAVHDPFVPAEPYASAEESRRGIAAMNGFVRDLSARGVEANLVRLPFCHVARELWAHSVNSGQFYRDHQQYRNESYALAAALHRRGPIVAGKVVQMLLGRHTSYANPIDSKLLPWLLDRPWIRARIWSWHKLTRHRAGRGGKEPPAGSLVAGDIEIEGAHQALCTACSVRHICDRLTRGIADTLPGLTVCAQPGEVVRWPLIFTREQPKYYDDIDASRSALDRSDDPVVQRAIDIVSNRPPSREVSYFDYGTEGQWSHQMQGGVRWHSYTNTEKVSTPIATLSPPFTVSVTFGGGMAESIGFSAGRRARIVCPMLAFHHSLVLHVEADGRYVLLRDGHAIPPMEPTRDNYVPERVGDRTDLRLVADNIDGTLVTQTILLWEAADRPDDTGSIDYSVVIVSARYARRLQAVLQSLVHQEGFDVRRLEVVIAYVPGIDSTEDVLDSLGQVHPTLRIVRAPFVDALTRSKGFLINEACKLARGAWVVLLDSDILVPPDVFASMDRLPAECMFAAPDGRKMLTPETTAKILLGEIQPWAAWQSLLKDAGEFRFREVDGVPIGFFQAVRRECLDKVPYAEYEHFEGADWAFGKAIRDTFGMEVRLPGPVLHLDHGGSKWYGTRKHF